MMADSPAKMQLPFHNAQAITRRIRPTRSVIVLAAVVLLLIGLASWPAEDAPPAFDDDQSLSPMEKEIHAAAKSMSDPKLAFPEKAQCMGMSCFAYAQHAAHVSFLCNSLMIFETLHRTGSAADRVLLHNSDWVEGSKTYAGKLLAKAKNEYRVKLVPVKMPHSGDQDWVWQENFAKFYTFSQTQYQRILVLDSDSVLLKHMDDLFSTKPAKMAATLAYWRFDNKISSNVMLIEPSKADFDRVLAAIAKRSPDEFDVDILNKVFGPEAVLIPHRTNNLISGEFRTANHTGYLIDGGAWNATAMVEEARYVHFSDLYNPKPWQSENPQDVQNTIVPCWKHPDQEKEDCTSRESWLWLYKDFMKRRQGICEAR